MNEKKGQKLAVLIVTSLMLVGLFPWNLFQCLYFLIFLSMIFVFIENSDICNLAENNTLRLVIIEFLQPTNFMLLGL